MPWPEPRCQELTEQLQAEQQAHGSTRRSLTAALGDTVDALKPEAALAVKPGEAMTRA
jgi:hypothetical protein